MFSLWKYDDNGSLVPDVEEIKLITEFRNLWRNKIGTIGDINGINKLANTEYLRYIFFMDDFRSPWIDLPEKERHIKALKETVFWKACEVHNLEPVGCFKGESLLTAARKRYRWLQETAEVKILIGLKRGLHNIRVLIDVLNKNMNKISDLPDDEEPTMDQIALAMKASEDIITLSEKIPKALDNIQTYEKKVYQQLKMQKYAKGNVKIGNRADPVLEHIKLD